MNGPLGLPLAASAHAGEVDQTMVLVHILMAVLFVGWALFFLYALYRFRRNRNPVADYKGVTGHTSTYLEIAVAVVEAVLLIGFSVPLWAKRVAEFPAESDAVVVRVVGEQFAWNIHYPGPDGKFGKTDIALIDLQTNPLGLDRSDPDAKDDITTFAAVRIAAERAYRMAGIGPADIDLAEVHDCFTIAEIIAMEELGFCAKGDGGPYVASGATRIDGSRPVNTSGGLKSKGHPVGATGVAQICDLVMQMRGEAGERQLTRNKLGLAQNLGGSGATSVVTVLGMV